MCGIIGEIASSPVNETRFCQMRDALAHRGPDGAGLYKTPDRTVALGFRRLSIIDLSDAGMQPLANEDETCYLLFNGEIYNYRTLHDELRRAGHKFTSETDSEVILHGYEEWGESVTERLRGMFAFTIWDERTSELFMARDPFGIKPLVYYYGPDRFVFSSELKGILADEQVPREISQKGLHQYLRYRYIPAPLTIWEGMYKLPPGHQLVYDGEGIEVDQYWNLSSHVGSDTPPEDEATSELLTRLEDSISSHLVSDVPIGILLSGGLDSSTIAALTSRSDEDLAAFSMGFEGADDELSYAQAVGETFNLDHRKRVLNTNHLDELLDDILETYDEPLADSSIFPTYLLMREAGEEMKVVLGGDGGDELFGGYTWYDRNLLFKKFDSISPLLRPLHTLVATTNAKLRSNLVQSLEWRLELAALTGFQQYQMGMSPPLSRTDQERILTPEFLHTGESTDDVSRFGSDDMCMKDLQYLDLNTFLPGDILAKVDRASMAHSLEVRVPFLDESIAEYAFSLDDEILTKDNRKKHLLKRVGRTLLPDEIVDRPKSGFGAPLSEMGFFQDNRDTLRDSVAAADGIFDQAGLDEYLESNPKRNNLFKLILFELWYRRWRSA